MRKKSLVLFLVVAMLFALTAANLSATQAALYHEGKAPSHAGEKVDVLVGFHGTPNPGLVRAFGGEIYAEFTLVDVIAARMTEQQAKALTNHPSISYIEPDGLVYAISQEVPWGIDRVFDVSFEADPYNSSSRAETWDITKGSGIGVAVLDTGIDTKHKDLKVAGGIRFYTTGLLLRSDNKYSDVHGHGTHVAGTIAALDNNEGVVGVAPAVNLYAVKVLTDSGSGSISAIVAGIEWAVAQPDISIINMSLGSSSYSQTFESACDAAWSDGLLVISSAGNNGNTGGTGDNVGYPARYGSVIAVAASDDTDKRAYFSSTGSAVELIAPGLGIKSTVPGGYATYSGTSMASPHVAGVAALVWAAKPRLSNAEVRSILTDNAEDLGLGLNHQGKGLVRADLAVAAIAESSIAVTNVAINESDQTLGIGDTVQLSVTIMPANATNKAVTWSSSNDNVALADESGLVTAVAAGTATITVTTIDGSHTDSIIVTVTDPQNGEPPAERITVESIIYAAPGPHLRVTIKVVMVDENGAAIPNAPVSNAEVAIVLYRDGASYASTGGSTGSDGTVTFSYQRVPAGTYRTEVIRVMADGLIWDGNYPVNSYLK